MLGALNKDIKREDVRISHDEELAVWNWKQVERCIE